MSANAICSKTITLPVLIITLASLINCMWPLIAEQGPLNASAQDTSSNRNSNFRTFENIAFGFRMLYPSDWTVTEVKSTLSPNASTSVVAFFKAPIKSPSDVYQENVIINIKGPSPDDLTLRDYTENSLNTFRNMPNIRLLQSFPNTLAGLPAHMVVYSENVDGVDIQKMQLWTIVGNDTAYVVTFGAEQTQFSTYLPAAEQMINSIQIIEPVATIVGLTR
jgi:eukaryotic-like serine/threonine-protein kinase